METIKKIFDWIAKIFQDQKGNPSSKRVFLVISTILFFKIVNNDIAGNHPTDTIVYAVVLTTWYCLGLITSEFFKNNPWPK